MRTASVRMVAHLTGAKLFSVDEAHFYADADLRGINGEALMGRVSATPPHRAPKLQA